MASGFVLEEPSPFAQETVRERKVRSSGENGSGFGWSGGGRGRPDFGAGIPALSIELATSPSMGKSRM
jgi:hypothetical protein